MQIQSVLFLSLFCFLSVYAQQTTPFVLTEFPLIAISGESEVTIKWAGASSDPTIALQPANERFPDSATLYFSTDPGGGEIENYTDSVTVFVAESTFVGLDAQSDSLFEISYVNCKPQAGYPPERKIKFRPAEQINMGPGVYYYIVARRASIAGNDTLFYSNELKMIVEADDATKLKTPDLEEKVTNLTPVFSWEKNPGVPYYHIILSDEKIDADLENQSIEGLSVVWQAITGNTQITYGAPDPSGTLTANPPPMSPGQTYSWVVLNNYGNHPAFTSKRFGLPRNFTIVGDSLKSPVSIFPQTGDTIEAAALNAEQVEFAWTNLDTAANTYKLYLYVAQDFEGIEAQMVVWENEYTAGSFENDTARVLVNLKDILTNNKYTWKVTAVDDKGAGKSGNLHSFVYRGIPTGVMKVKTGEQISFSGSTVTKDVAAAKIEVEVLEGSMEAPLLFYTDMNGNLTRERPAGKYRITAVKEGFESLSKTVTVEQGDTAFTVFYLKRPDATVYGKVIDESGSPVDLANVYGVSDRGDTIKAEADALGNFVMNCYGADWSIWTDKTGYVGTVAQDTSVQYGQNINIGKLVLKRNRYILSGVVKNSKGEPLLGANVRLLRNSTVIDQQPSTSQQGTFSFSVEPGTYTITADKTGFVTYRKVQDVVGSRQLTVSMAAGAAQIKGSVVGQSWSGGRKVYAPITNANVLLIDTSVVPPDSIQTKSDAVYGDFTVSVSGDKAYKMVSRANGYVAHDRETLILAEPGKTHVITDTLKGLARFDGAVRVSGTSTGIGDVAVVLTDSVTRQVRTSSISDASGMFELSGLSDGVYQVTAGKEGFAADTVFLIDTAGNSLHANTFMVEDGRAVLGTENQTHIIDRMSICVAQGEKTIAWRLFDGNEYVENASVKIHSPLQKSIRAVDSLKGVGSGGYVMSIDADDQSIIDLALHRLEIAVDDARELIIDTVNLTIVHTGSDSMEIEGGTVNLSLSSKIQLDEATLFYKDHGANDYESVSADTMQHEDDTYVYRFSPNPRKNGSVMLYYFRAKIGNDQYGYEQEVFRTYIKPDRQTLSRIVVEPFGDDTLLLPAKTKISFTLKGYYGSQFIPDENLDESAVSWKLKDNDGCKLSSESGLQTVLETGDEAGGIIYLIASIDTSKKRVDAGISQNVVVPLKISGQRLDSIVVKRVDSENDFLTAGPLARAEFTAKGVDKKGKSVTISPDWSLWPDNAGTIEAGSFIPHHGFSGRVRITARVNNVLGTYNRQVEKKINSSGLLVRYVIPVTADSVTNGQGCTVVFPDSVVILPDRGELQIEIPLLRNRVQRNTNEYNVIGNAYDIDEINDVPLHVGEDSIVIALAVPQGYQQDASSGKGLFVVGRWHEDSLKWVIIPSTRISDDGSRATVRTSHFSRYAILHKVDDLKGIVTVSPNPFSPYIRPVQEFGAQYGTAVPMGVCFEVTPVAQMEPLNVSIDIYSVTGAHILNTKLPNPEREKTYHVWWDGKTIHKERVKMVRIEDARYRLEGKEMCRNGRYFVVVTIEDGEGRKKQYMKPVVLFK